MTFVLEPSMAPVNSPPAIFVAMSYRPGTAAKRMRALLEELIGEAGGLEERGARARAIERSGLNQSHFSKIINDQRGIGLPQFETVVLRLKLRWDYFFGPVEPRSYRDFVGSRYPALSEFLATEEGRTSKPDERVFLGSAVFAAGEPDVNTYRALSTAYRGAYGWRSTAIDGGFDEDHDLDAALGTKKRIPSSGEPRSRREKRHLPT